MAALDQAPTHWIVPIAGNLQDLGAETGMGLLWHHLRSGISLPSCHVVTPREWHDDHAALASFIKRHGQHPRIMAIGYSWGAGHGVMQFAKAIGELDLSIEIACLADPVYRHPWLPSWLQVRSLLNYVLAPTITVPWSIREVRWVRQRRSKPMGHDLRRPNQTLAGIEPARQLDHHDHFSIDESTVFRRFVYRAATDFLGARHTHFDERDVYGSR
jgi:hypothetical protein